MDNNLTNEELEFLKNIDKDFGFSEPVLNRENSIDKTTIFKQLESLESAVQLIQEINKIESSLSKLNEEDDEFKDLAEKLSEKLSVLENDFSTHFDSYTHNLLTETESNISSGLDSMENLVQKLNSVLK